MDSQPTTAPDEAAIAQILAGLNEAQAYATSLSESSILNAIAGTSSDKTRTLVHRVARLVAGVVPPSAILLLTFTRRVVAKMLQRARERGPASAGVEGGTSIRCATVCSGSIARTWGLAPTSPSSTTPTLNRSCTASRKRRGSRAAATSTSPKPGLWPASSASRATWKPTSLPSWPNRPATSYPYAQAILKEAAEAFTLAKREQQLID